MWPGKLLLLAYIIAAPFFTLTNTCPSTPLMLLCLPVVVFAVGCYDLSLGITCGAAAVMFVHTCRRQGSHPPQPAAAQAQQQRPLEQPVEQQGINMLSVIPSAGALSAIQGNTVD
eukprot:jgi/Chrzof1/13477/UNPLg00563.t1